MVNRAIRVEVERLVESYGWQHEEGAPPLDLVNRVYALYWRAGVAAADAVKELKRRLRIQNVKLDSKKREVVSFKGSEDADSDETKESAPGWTDWMPPDGPRSLEDARARGGEHVVAESKTPPKGTRGDFRRLAGITREESFPRVQNVVHNQVHGGGLMDAAPVDPQLAAEIRARKGMFR